MITTNNQGRIVIIDTSETVAPFPLFADFTCNPMFENIGCEWNNSERCATEFDSVDHALSAISTAFPPDLQVLVGDIDHNLLDHASVPSGP